MTDLSTNSFDYIVSFGCSLARGEELKNKNKRYAQLIANHYNAKLLDYSVPGNSIENISQSAINVLLSNKDKILPSRTLVHIGWTYSTRLNFCGKNNGYYVIAEYNLNPDRRKYKLSLGHDHIYFNDDFDDPMDVKAYYNYHTNLSYLLYNMSKYIHHTQMFLKTNKYNYIFSFADNVEKELILSPDNSYKMLGIKKTFTNSTFPNFSYILNDIDTSYICNTAFMNHTKSLDLEVGPEHHPLEDGHAAYAKVLINFIESKYGQAK